MRCHEGNVHFVRGRTRANMENENGRGTVANMTKSHDLKIFRTLVFKYICSVIPYEI